MIRGGPAYVSCAPGSPASTPRSCARWPQRAAGDPVGVESADPPSHARRRDHPRQVREAFRSTALRASDRGQSDGGSPWRRGARSRRPTLIREIRSGSLNAGFVPDPGTALQPTLEGQAVEPRRLSAGADAPALVLSPTGRILRQILTLNLSTGSRTPPPPQRCWARTR